MSGQVRLSMFPKGTKLDSLLQLSLAAWHSKPWKSSHPPMNSKTVHISLPCTCCGVRSLITLFWGTGGQAQNNLSFKVPLQHWRWLNRGVGKRCENTLFEGGAPDWYCISAAKFTYSSINQAFVAMMSLLLLVHFLGGSWKQTLWQVDSWHTYCIIINIFSYTFLKMKLLPVSFP